LKETLLVNACSSPKLPDIVQNSCELSILNSGLESLTIFIIENTREIVNSYPQINFQKSKKIFHSKEFTNLGKREI
jgi:hypothetical protein